MLYSYLSYIFFVVVVVDVGALLWNELEFAFAELEMAFGFIVSSALPRSKH